MAEEKKSDDLAACTEKDLETFDLDFASNPKNELAMNIVTHTELTNAALSRKARLTHDHVYSVSIPEEGKPVCAQNSTGRCWLFAALNVMRYLIKYQPVQFFSEISEISEISLCFSEIHDIFSEFI